MKEITIKNTIPVEILIEIENELMFAGDVNHLRYTKLSKLMHKVDTTCDELAHAIDLADKMPICDIYNLVLEHDIAFSEIDEVAFVLDIAKKYNVTRDDAVFRIQSVRKVNKELERLGQTISKYQKSNGKTITKMVEFTISMAVARAMLVGYGYLQRVVDEMNDDEVFSAVLKCTDRYGAKFRIIE